MWITIRPGTRFQSKLLARKRRRHLAALSACSAVEDVPAAGGVRRRRECESENEREDETLHHVL